MSFDCLRDLYKDTYGVRPSTAYMEAFEAQSEAEQTAAFESLLDQFSENEERERQEQLAAQKAFETRIAGMQADYGISRATAMRWDTDAFEVDIAGALERHGSAAQEVEFYLYKQGIAFCMYATYVSEILPEEAGFYA